MRRMWIGVLAGLALMGAAATVDAAALPEVKAVPGTPVLALASYDLKALGYQVDEYFLSGTAQSYKAVGETGPDGRWQAAPNETAPFVTRIVVVRPSDPKKFNGTVAVEWLNVSGGLDVGPDWSFTHREMIRKGYAYVGVSAQKVGVEGGPSMAGSGGAGALKKMNPQRYGALIHPGDAYAWDMFSQAGRVAREGHVLGPLQPKRILALGESQSAIYLTTYVNAIDPLAKVFDGFFIHSRFGGAPLLTPGPLGGPGARAQSGIKYRTDLRVPVMTLIAETDLIGSGLNGYWTASQPDNAKLRVWEMPGTAHADTYMFQVSANDSGSTPPEKLAELWKPSKMTIVGPMAKPINSAPQHHYVAQAALAALETWVRTGKAPPTAPRMETTGEPPKLVADDNGNTRGGIRTPWVDAPTSRLSGLGNSGGAFAGLLGTTDAFDAATLAKLYPGGKEEYLKKFDASLARAVKAGFILPADQAEARAVAAASWPK